MEPFLTVIVPAYQVEDYMGQCLESLIFQTDRDFQILVVDDGSTDATGRIAEEYCRRFPGRIRILSQENRGLGAARNRGLCETHTPYVTFLDSDDWMDLSFVSRVRQRLSQLEQPPDILFTLPWVYDSVTHRALPWKDRQAMEAVFFPEGQAVTVDPRTCPELWGLEPSVNRRVFRLQFLKDIDFSFPEGTHWEDVEPHFAVLSRARRCVGLRDTGFFYRIGRKAQITEDRGRSRMELIPVMEAVLDRARGEAWTRREIAWALRMLWGFSRWSIGCVDSRWSGPFLKELHRFYRNVPGGWIISYLRTCPESTAEDALGIFLLRSPFYPVLRDYRIRRWGHSLGRKLRRRKT